MRTYQDVMDIKDDNEVFLTYRDVIDILPSDDVITSEDYTNICNTIIKRCFSINPSYGYIKSFVYSTQVGVKKNFVTIIMHVKNDVNFYYNVLANFNVNVNKEDGYIVVPFNFYFTPGIVAGIRLYNNAEIQVDSFAPAQTPVKETIKHFDKNKNEFVVLQVASDFFARDPLRSVSSPKDKIIVELMADIWGIIKCIDFFGIDFCGLLSKSKDSNDKALPFELDRVFLVRLLCKDSFFGDKGHCFIIFDFGDNTKKSELSSVAAHESFSMDKIIFCNKALDNFLKKNNIPLNTQDVVLNSAESIFNIILDKLKDYMSHKHYNGFSEVNVIMPIDFKKCNPSVIKFAENDLSKIASEVESFNDSDLCSGGVSIASEDKKINASKSKIKNTENIDPAKILTEVDLCGDGCTLAADVKNKSDSSDVENVISKKILTDVNKCDDGHMLSRSRSDSHEIDRVAVKRVKSDECVYRKKDIAIFDKISNTDQLNDKRFSDLPTNDRLKDVSLECIVDNKSMHRTISCDK